MTLIKRSSVSSLVGGLLILGTITVQASGAPAPAVSAPTVTFDGHTVKASDITRRGQVVFFALGLVPNGFDSTVVRWSQVVGDDAGLGAVTFDAGRAVPCKSIWAVVDLTSGQFTLAAPPGCPLRRATMSTSAFKHGPDRVPNVFAYSRPFLDLLYVDPGKGAWTIRSAADGYPTDTDGRSDGVTTVTLASAHSLLPDQTPPRAFVPGAVLVAIDLYMLDVAAERLDEKMLSEVLP